MITISSTIDANKWLSLNVVITVKYIVIVVVDIVIG